MKLLQLLQNCKGEVYEELYANEGENLGQMDKFLEKCNS